MTRSTTVQAAGLVHDQVEPARSAANAASEPSVAPARAEVKVGVFRRAWPWLRERRGLLLLVLGGGLAWFGAREHVVAFINAIGIPSVPGGTAAGASQWSEPTAAVLRLLLAAAGLYWFIRREIHLAESRLGDRISDTNKRIDTTNKRIDDTNDRTDRRIEETKTDLVKRLLLGVNQNQSGSG